MSWSDTTITSQRLALRPFTAADADEAFACITPTLTRYLSFEPASTDRKSTRLNSSHSQISYAVFCLKKKKKKRQRAYVGPTSRSKARRPQSDVEQDT